MIHHEITGDILRAAIRVHTELGPGMLESAYRKCMQHDLVRRGRTVVLSYLRMSKRRVGILINFNVALLRDGIKRIVN